MKRDVVDQQHVALEMYLSPKNERLYVTTGSPGQLHVFDLAAGFAQPKLLASYPAANGAHHVGFTKDGRYAFVQNSLLNLPNLADGSCAMTPFGMPLSRMRAVNARVSTPVMAMMPRALSH